MKRYLVPVWVIGLAAILVLSTGACGSGGGGVVTGVALFSGTYCSIGWVGADGVPDDGESQWGSFSPDGAGMVGATTFDNTNGVLGGPNVTPPLPYTVDAGLRLSLLFGGLPLLQGGISSDGKLVCLASVFSGGNPGIFIMGRKEGVFSTASLNGPYHLAVFFYDDGTMDDGTLFAGTMTFNGAGATTSSAMQNLQGAISAVGPFAGTYTVAADGTITGDFFSGAASMEGAVLCGGELIIMAGSTTGGEIPSFAVLIRETAGAGNPTFNGSYYFVDIEASNAPPPETWLSTTGTVSADGAGVLTFGAFTSNDDGTVTTFPPPGIPGAYTVMGNGALDFGGGFLVGAVSASGRTAFVAGGTGGGDDPEFVFFMR